MTAGLYRTSHAMGSAWQCNNDHLSDIFKKALQSTLNPPLIAGGYAVLFLIHRRGDCLRTVVLCVKDSRDLAPVQVFGASHISAKIAQPAVLLCCPRHLRALAASGTGLQARGVPLWSDCKTTGFQLRAAIHQLSHQCRTS